MRIKLISVISAIIIISASQMSYSRYLGTKDINHTAPSNANGTFGRWETARSRFCCNSKVGDDSALIWRSFLGATVTSVGRYEHDNDDITFLWNRLVADNYLNMQNANTSPLLIDFNRDGFQVGKPGVGVLFDLQNDGVEDYIQWVAVGTDDGFLVRDINKNGFVDNGSELFGNGTDLELGEENLSKAAHGYEALAQFDLFELGGNSDNKINRNDAIWSELFVWIDRDSNGASSSDELTPIHETKILSLNLKYRVDTVVDESGNELPFKSWVRVREETGPKRVRMTDIFFKPL